MGYLTVYACKWNSMYCTYNEKSASIYYFKNEFLVKSCLFQQVLSQVLQQISQICSSCLKGQIHYLILVGLCLYSCSWDAGCSCNLPNHACWSPWTSIAKPKSASFTAAPFTLLASSKFSGCKRDIKISENQKCIRQNQCFFIASRWSSKLRIYCCFGDISFSQDKREESKLPLISHLYIDLYSILYFH